MQGRYSKWYEDTEDGFPSPENGVGVYSKNFAEDSCRVYKLKGKKVMPSGTSPGVAQEWVKATESDMVTL